MRALVEAQLDESASGEVSLETLRTATDRILAAVDREFGGFGHRPKFPHPATVTFLLHRWCAEPKEGILDAIVRTLDGMAAGGIRDQVGGGFHRYSTDERWIIPHFEKMSYDNSELLKAYLDGFALFGAADHARVARETVRWVREVLSLPGGGIAASQDADVGPGDDGDYFTWTRVELEETLGPDLAELAAARFGLETLGRMEHRPARNVLYVAASIDQLARRLARPAGEIEADFDRAIELLREARGRRPAPFVDQTRYAAWNAMMASALLRGEVVLGDRWAGEHALATLRRLRAEQSAGAVVFHGAGGAAGLLEDQVHVAAAALDAFEATGDPDWLDWSAALMERAHADCWDPVGGGYFDAPAPTARGEGLLATRARPIQDSPTPSPNGVAGVVLARLAELTREPQWDERRRRLIQAFGERAADLGLFGSTYLLAVDWLLLPATHLVVTGPAADPLAAELHQLARAAFVPRRTVLRLTPELAARLPLTPPLQAMLRDPSRVAGYACTGERCLAPAQDLETWRDTLTRVRGET